MRKKKLIACFQDTLEMSKIGTLGKKTAKSIQSNKVYKEGFISKKGTFDKYASIIVRAGTSFEIAGRYREFGKIAVLNFANPQYPGGGVVNGAMAQEECLCRSSNLYACISDKNVFEDYYEYHRTIGNYFFSDRLIYTKDVVVFKNDNDIPKRLPQKDWFTVDIITCAAPYLGNRKYTNSMVLLNLFKSRIKNIFEAARENNVDVIVLGAFGCGAFQNPPLIVAEAFKEVIFEENYDKALEKIVFAIKPTGEYCPNLHTFQKYFGNFEFEECSLLYSFSEDNFRRTPVFVKNVSIENWKFYSWQIENKYFGKQFSILGDSLSTLEGYNPIGYKVFYKGENCNRTGVRQKQDTWWDKVISYFGGELLVNNAFSGSRVTKFPRNNKDSSLFPAGCSEERTSSLHMKDVLPDVILVYLGTNDWIYGVSIENKPRILDKNKYEKFSFAYSSMLKKLKKNYPKSEIWCCTLNETYMSCNSKFVFPHEYAGIHIEEYNEVIRRAVKKNDCKLMDLYHYKIPYDTIDGSHATADGMTTIAKMIIRTMLKEDEACFFDCEDEEHEYVEVERHTVCTEYICKKCGKTSLENLFKIQQEENPKEEVKFHGYGSFEEHEKKQDKYISTGQ